MLELSPENISAFWESLDKMPRMDIWSGLPNEIKLKLLFSNDENSLDDS